MRLHYGFPLTLLTACVAYRPAPVELEDLAAEVDARSAPAPLDYEAAVRHARAFNPELRRLAAEARAAGLDVPPAGFSVMADFHEEGVMATTDPLALARVGPRGAAAKAAAARRRAVLAEARDTGSRIAVEVAEAFAVERTLRDLAPPAVGTDPAPFRAAGLASDTDAARLAAARASHAAEVRTIAAERDANLARLRRLLGLGPDAALELALPEEELPPRPEPTRELLLRRPDLATALRRYEAADAEFRAKVVDQYPSLRIGPRIPFSFETLNPLVGLEIPFGAAGPARAARERREAARHDVEAAVLAAEEQIAALAAELDAAEARAAARRAGADAMEAALAVALRRLEIEADAFPEVAEMAGRAVMESAEARMAEVEAVRTRARFARACGWPFDAEEETR